MKKYKFTGESKKWGNRTLLRIVATRDFGSVKAGEVGGWIEKESNLSHEGNCWVYDNGAVYGNGKVYSNGRVYGHGLVHENGVVCDNGRVHGNGIVSGNGIVRDNGRVGDNGMVYGNGRVGGNGAVYDNGAVCGNGIVRDNGIVYGNGVVTDNGVVYDNGVVETGTIIGKVSRSYKDIFQHQCKNRLLTAILTEDNEILYTIGCRENITKEEFIERIYSERGGLERNPHRQEYLAIIECAEIYFSKVGVKNE